LSDAPAFPTMTRPVAWKVTPGAAFLQLIDCEE
jgi:hypothetical protein